MTNKLILVKEGNSTPNLFADFREYVNNSYPLSTNSPKPIFAFFNQAQYTFQLVKNIRSSTTTDGLAISHYNNIVQNPSSNQMFFKVLDLSELCNAVDEYGYAVFGAIQHQQLTSANALMFTSVFARDTTNNTIKNLRTGETYNSSMESLPIVSFFGLTRINNLPVYYLMPDSTVLKAGIGVDITNDEFAVHSITDYDGSIRDNIITPQFSSNTVFVNNTLYVTGDLFNISLFDSPFNLLRTNNIDTSSINVTVQTNLITKTILNGNIQFDIPPQTTMGYIKIQISGGTFLDCVTHTERLAVDFSVVKMGQ